ncbi:MAG: FAA hydrolase family protein, partial [Burkholderiaceae bacterium]|nr:FAA hydrolase family protein [Burkholderiaceae bacterium]
KVPEIISNLSHQYRLMPGDLIYTGTPAGVSAVSPGDTLVAEVAGLPRLTIRIG